MADMLFLEERSCIDGGLTQFFFDAKKLVVFGHSVAPREAEPVLICPSTVQPPNLRWSNLSFATAVAGNRGITVSRCQLNGVNRFA